MDKKSISYCNEQFSKIKITDRQIIEEVISSLESEISGNYEERTGTYMCVTIDDVFFDITRDIFISEAVSERLLTLQETRDEIFKIITGIAVPSDNIAIECSGLTPDYAKLLYETFLNEFSQMSVDEQFEIITCNRNDSSINYIGRFQIEKYIDGHDTILTLPITALTPDTFSEYMKYNNKCNEKTLLKILEDGNPESDGWIGFYIAEMTDDDNLVQLVSYDMRNSYIEPFENAINLDALLIDFVNNEQGSYEAFDNIDSTKYYLCRVELTDYNLDGKYMDSEYFFLLDKTSGIVETINKLYEDLLYDDEYYDDYDDEYID